MVQLAQTARFERGIPVQTPAERTAAAVRRLESAVEQGKGRLERARAVAHPEDPLVLLYEREVKRLRDELARLRAQRPA